MDHRPGCAPYYDAMDLGCEDIDDIDVIDPTPSIEEVMIAWEAFHIYADNDAPHCRVGWRALMRQYLDHACSEQDAVRILRNFAVEPRLWPGTRYGKFT